MAHSLRPDENVLLVSIQGLGPKSVEWAVKQPWIDVVSNSWGTAANVPQTGGAHVFTRPWVEKRGGMFIASAGNGVSNFALCDRSVTTASWMSGPPWHLIVGAVSGWNKQPSCYSSIPPDVSSYGNKVKAALAGTSNKTTAFEGTSAAAPIVSSVAATLILEARRALGDHREGPRAGLLASGARTRGAAGLLKDGKASRKEVEDAVLKTAIRYPFDPSRVSEDPLIWPDTPAFFLYEGYGVVNGKSLAHALGVLRGSKPMPDRADVDRWMDLRDSVGYLAYDYLL
jgi:hypothetical protein